MDVFQKLSIVAASVVLSYAAIPVKSVGAATILYNFKLNGTSGLLGSGSFKYDNSTQTDVGDNVIQVTSLNLDLGGQQYTEKNEVGDPPYPTIEFLDGKLLGLSYRAQGSNPFNLINLSYSDFFSSGLGRYEEGTVTYSLSSPKSVPEPSSTVETLAILGLGGFLLKKKVSYKK